jgi:hypothetical protein
LQQDKPLKPIARPTAAANHIIPVVRPEIENPSLNIAPALKTNATHNISRNMCGLFVPPTL